jgi:hypothetical protein
MSPVSVSLVSEVSDSLLQPLPPLAPTLCNPWIQQVEGGEIDTRECNGNSLTTLAVLSQADHFALTVDALPGPLPQTDHFTLTVAALLGEPWPAPATLPGRVHICRDSPIDPADLVGITDPTELARVLGIRRIDAVRWLKQQAAAPTAPTTSTPEHLTP